MGAFYFNYDRNQSNNNLIEVVCTRVSDGKKFVWDVSKTNNYMFDKGVKFSLKVTAKLGYRFISASYKNGSNGAYTEEIPLKIDESGKFFIHEGTSPDNINMYYMDMEKFDENPPSETINIKFTNIDVIGNLNDTPLKVNEDNIFNVGEYIVTFTTKKDYKITNAYYYKKGFYTPIDILDNGNKIVIHFTYDDKGVQTIYIDTVKEVRPIENSMGFNHIYIVDSTILNEVAKERFSNGTMDLGQFILNVLELPFNVNDLLGDINPIQLGNVLLKTNAMELINDELILQLGSITVPSKYHNSYDFIDTIARLHLPYVNTINLDLEYVINHTITITYIIDLYTGDATVNIYSSKIDSIIHSERVTLGREIPFKSPDTSTRQGNITSNRGLNNRLDNAFIEVIRNIPYEMDNPFNSEIRTQTRLINEKGFLKVNEIILETNATLQEKTMIQSILNQGVYIK